MPTTHKSFLEVRTSDAATVEIDGEIYNLGAVKSIFASHRNYIVWFDDKDDLWYEVNHKLVVHDDEFHAFWNNCRKLASESLHNLSSEQRRAAIEMRASALSSALESKYESANLAIIEAFNYINSVNERVSKKRYLVGVIGSAALACAIAMLLFAIYRYFPVDDIFQSCGTAMSGGALGAILSAATGKIEEARFDANATAIEGYMNGTLRVLYGLCGSFVVVMALRSGLIDSKLISSDNERFFAFLLAVAGGFVERFSANLLTGLSSTSK